jgi:hypothetical protein
VQDASFCVSDSELNANILNLIFLSIVFFQFLFFEFVIFLYFILLRNKSSNLSLPSLFLCRHTVRMVSIDNYPFCHITSRTYSLSFVVSSLFFSTNLQVTSLPNQCKFQTNIWNTHIIWKIKTKVDKNYFKSDAKLKDVCTAKQYISFGTLEQRFM